MTDPLNISHFVARKIHIPSDFVVDQEASDVESGLYREILSLDNVLSSDSLSNNISNINGLRFYHEIRWNLEFAAGWRAYPVR